MKILTATLFLIISLNVSANESFLPECPKTGNLEVVTNPREWADNCFKAINGRFPSNDQEYSSKNIDIDLDGKNEHIEIRGVGNKLKQIYVFKRGENTFKYMGALDAPLDFQVVRGSDEKASIIGLYRQGYDAVFIIQFKYMDNQFKQVAKTKVQ